MTFLRLTPPPPPLKFVAKIEFFSKNSDFSRKIKVLLLIFDTRWQTSAFMPLMSEPNFEKLK